MKRMSSAWLIAFLAILLPSLAMAQQSDYVRLMAAGLQSYKAQSYADADLQFRRALEAATTDKQRARSHCTLGVVAQKSNRAPDAKRHAERALALAPDDASIRELAGEVGLTVNASTGSVPATPRMPTTPVGAPISASNAPLDALLKAPAGTMPQVWSGHGIQGHKSWSMEVTFSGVDNIVRYPSLNCSGRWTRMRETEHSITYVESITKGSGCLNYGIIQIVASGDDALSFNYHIPSRRHDPESTPLARAHLSRGPLVEFEIRRLSHCDTRAPTVDPRARKDHSTAP